jgi:hypothetical protein
MEQFKCERCSNPFLIEWRKDITSIKYSPLRYCSRSCSNSRGKRSEETKNRISESLKKRVREVKQPKVYNSECIVCKKVFDSKRKRKTCSFICKNYLGSLNRQKYIKENGSFSTKREEFTYKGISLKVDSNLEKAGIIYLIDNLNIISVERFNNIINFWEGSTHRTFNPDFICKLIDNTTAIVEVKQKWLENSTHIYNKNIPLKRQALKLFCDERNYQMIWLDFKEVPELKQIYYKVLKNRKFLVKE